ncbi:MAG: hypothetical protein ACREQ1_02055 [Woeseiaceae bacterium]
MNCSPVQGIRRRAPYGANLLVITFSTLLSACNAPAFDAQATESPEDRVYRMDYRVTPDPERKGARVELTVTQRSDFLREVDMPLRDGQISDVSGDGEVSVEDDRVVWTLPERGGSLRWFARINNLRADDEYDAYIDEDWALFRGEDIIPSASTRALARAASETTLTFDLPRDWSSVTPYFGLNDSYEIVNPERDFDTPTGWIVLGDIGVRFETIGHVRTKVAGPTGHAVRRMDMLALLRWTLPELLRLLPDFPKRLTFVSAGAPMWRGALSAPQSAFVHADRPLISENSTSTMLHETLHIGLGLSAESGADWIVEGFAEYYGLEMLRRSGTISNDRYRTAHRDLESWGREVDDLCTRRSNGSDTARAVTILVELNGEIEKATDGEADLDDVLRELAGYDEEITVEGFREIVAEIADGPMDALDANNLPGC